MPPPLPASTFIVLVMKGGNDVTGQGDDERPFLTIGKGLAVAGGLGASASQPALVLVGPGTYPENVEISPFTFLCAMEPGFTVAITGAGTGVALAPSWVGPATPIGGIAEIFVENNAVIDFTGVLSGTFFFGANGTVLGTTTVTGDAVNGGFISFGVGFVAGGPVSWTGVSEGSNGAAFGSLVTVASSATQLGDLGSSSDEFEAGLTLDASAGQNVNAIVNSFVVSPLTLKDGGGGVTSYTGPASAIPQTVIQLGGAAYPVRSTGPNALAAGAPGQVITTVGGVAVWAAPPTSLDVANGVIWRPGGVAAGNVVTTWADVMAAVTAVNGAITVYVDSSIAAATVPAGSYNGFGDAQIAPFDTGQGYVFTIADGATLVDWASMQGVTALCACVTTPAFSFNPNSAFLLFNFATISFLAGALVPACTITAADVSFTVFSRMGSIDNSAAPTIPVFKTNAGAFSIFYIHTAAVNFPFLFTGSEIGSQVGATV